MLISHSYKFIFIHPLKTGGTSIHKALEQYAHAEFETSREEEKVKFKVCGIYPWIFSNDFDTHITAGDLKNKIPKNIFQGYFKFAFVRNPWDREVSMYFYAKNKESHTLHELVKKVGSFGEFILWRSRNRKNIQKDFVCDKKGNTIVDFIGKYELLETDFKTVIAKIGLPGNKIELPHLNRSEHKSYREYYNDNTKNHIAEIYKKDIELFGYEF